MLGQGTQYVLSTLNGGGSYRSSGDKEEKISTLSDWRRSEEGESEPDNLQAED